MREENLTERSDTQNFYNYSRFFIKEYEKMTNKLTSFLKPFQKSRPIRKNI